MRLTTVFMIAAIMQVSASGFAQRVTFKAKQGTLQELFKAIKAQTGYNVVMSAEKLEAATPVSADFRNEALEKVLEESLEGQNLTYTIDQKTIVVREKEPSFLDNLVARFSAIDIRGKIIGENDQVLAGATVKVKGTNKITKSNEKGEFYLANVDEDAIIEVSCIGYMTKESKAKKDLGEIQLVMASADLNEVVINKGYYTEKRKLSTGSVARITSADIANQPVSNLLQAMQGRMPGVQITQQTGIPGGAFKVQIRGQNSLRTDGNDPLYLIDGVPFSSSSLTTALTSGLILQGGNTLSNINLADIESIEVLKDGDATAIYGSRGSNGVVLITTKKGSAGKTNVDFNIYSGAGTVAQEVELLNRRQYLDMRYESLKNDGLTASANDYDLVLWDTTRNTNWQKELLGGTANTTDAQMTISGGNVSTQFRIGANYRKEDMVFPGDFNDQKIAANFNITHASANQKLRLSLSGNYLINKSNLLYQDLTQQALELVPVAPSLNDENGELNWENSTWVNPLAYTLQPYKGTTNNLISNANISYEFLPGLLLRTTFGYTRTDLDQNAIFPKKSLIPTSTQLPSSRFSNGKTDTWIIEPQISWKRNLGTGKLDVLIGTTFQESTREGQSFVGTGFSSEALMGSIQAATTITPSGANYTAYRYNAVFARIGYNYKDKYIVNLTGRRDGSSRFGSGRQFGNFGAIGGAWIISNEQFIKEFLPFLSYAKARTSYGITGSDQIGDYGYVGLYNNLNFLYQGIRGLSPNNLFNNEFSWENTRKLEAGLELGFLKDRILLTGVVYRNRSDSQLVGYPLSLVTGFSSVQANWGAMIQNTGVEFDLNTKNIQSENFSWNTGINLSMPRNKLVKYPDFEGSPYADQYVIGESLNIQKLYHYLGANTQTGLYQYEDVDNNGTISYPTDLQTRFKIQQDFYGGMQNSLKYHNLTLDFLIQFVKQTSRMPLPSLSPGGVSNQPAVVLDRWQKPGDVKRFPKFSSDPSIFGGLANRSLSDMSIVDASYLRLKNVSLSYQLPENLCTKLKLKNLRVYMQCQNLLTVTNFAGLDPESLGNALPPLRVITAGLQLTL